VFGRDKRDDEDPFAALKEGGTYHSTPTETIRGIPGSASAAPPGATASTHAARSQARPQARRRRAARRARSRRRGGPALLLLRLAIPLGVAIIVIAAAHSSSSVQTPNISPTSPVAGFGAPGAVSVSRPTSYLSAKGLAAGLAHVKRLAPGSKLLLLRIDSHSLVATVTRGHGQAEEILLEPTSTLKESAGSGGSGGISFSQIRPAVPSHLIEQMGKRFHVRKRHINYLVADAFPGLPPMWGVYLTNGTNYQASLSGAGLHKNG
jgi:hypothetical protein